MKEARFSSSLSVVLFLFVGICQSAMAYNFKILSNKTGLSNSAVLSMCQDHNGYMWLGTCDGLNIYNGQNIRILKPSSFSNSLSGNLIESVIETHDNIFWIQTNYGLNRFNKTSGKIEYYNNFIEKNYLLKSRENDIYVYLNNSIFFYLPGLKIFKKEELESTPEEDILDVFIDSKNKLWVFKLSGADSYQMKRQSEMDVSFETKRIFVHKTDLLHCSHEKDIVYFVDKNFNFFEYNVIDNTTRFVANFKEEIEKRGEISSIIKHHNSYLVGFKTDGLIKIEPSVNHPNTYEKLELNIKSGIFCLLKDRNQDIIWVGTDGQGVYMCSSDAYSAKSTTFNTLFYRMSKPVRAIFLDKEKNLWIGSKGDGLLKISDYSKNKNITNNQITNYRSDNSNLSNNSVYALEKSRKDILWIGHDNGLDYYSYKDREIKNVNLQYNNQPVRYIHSICELNDSVIWMASVGEGIYMGKITGPDNRIKIKDLKQITIEDGEFTANYFFTVYKENDSTLWFGNRGYGAFKLNTNTLEIQSLKPGNTNQNKTLNDVFSMAMDQDNNHWFGTSFGLVKSYKGKKQVFNENHGFPNNTIHGILKGLQNNLWLSTNQGIIRFNRKLETFQIYSQSNGLEVIEFSDGAYFKDNVTGDLYFGGINGFVTISESKNISHDAYLPRIIFNKLTIFGKKFNINDFIHPEKEFLELDHNQNFFSINLTAIDYLNSNNYSYLYKLEGLNGTWIENGKSNTISFTNIPPGEYTLHARFKNPMANVSSKISSLNIRIRPPWYRTNLAFILYFLFYAILVFLIFRLIKKWYKLKNSALEAKLNENKKEELYESKLRFFTNITHELCTPLTLIQGPCEKILTHPQIDHQTEQYAKLIKNNSGKLNSLIQELIEFRKIDTDNKRVKIEPLQISEFTKDIASSLAGMSESKNITYTQNIEKDIIWNSDQSCYSKIITNLITNAFKYTDQNGSIDVNLTTENNQLVLSVINTGKGIKEEKISEIFDRYKILDELESVNASNFSSRNGLGLAICHSMTELLNGTISVTSIPGKQTQFKVSLPPIESDKNLDISIQESHAPLITASIDQPESVVSAGAETTVSSQMKSDSTILLIDDDEEMLWFLSDLFAGLYNVVPMNSSKKALEYLENNHIDLIISDILMPEIDGITFTKTIKQSKIYAHIPLILLSAVNSPDYQVKGIEAGAEIYLSKPFNLKYLTEIVNRFLIREENLKDYYNSIFSAIEIEEGNFIQKDDKEFFVQILSIIEENISDSRLSAETIANTLGYSKRNLYRRLKQITEKSITELIKEYRFKKVEKFLISTKLSTDEIMYKTGFHNRGHFYKIFKERNACTPKEYRKQHKEAFEQNPHNNLK
jgi:signal transduction histidine kinase/ligand-binding sensor domain-containing protein/DNA-binding response OmpR family regulator